MAVFTKLEKKDIHEFIDSYEIGKLEDFTGIIEGIENTNYKLICDGKPYILTIFEKRVRNEDLPFFMDLKIYLNQNKFKCPNPIHNNQNKIINSIKNKKAVIVSFIEGKQITDPTNKECFEVGKMIGNLHKITKNYYRKKENTLNIYELKKIFNKCQNTNNRIFFELFDKLSSEIKFLEEAWPKKLPSGINHADLFKDNIFFKDGIISGVIDFYFSCYHFFIYDLSIAINEWSFQDNGKFFNKIYFKSIIEGYSLSRKLETEEIEAFNVVLRIATVRILVTRLYDYLFHTSDAFVVKKDPLQYFNILKWHQSNKVF